MWNFIAHTGEIYIYFKPLHKEVRGQATEQQT